MFLYALPRLFHRRHALEWKVLSPEFLLHDGVKTSLQVAALVRRLCIDLTYLKYELKYSGQ